MPSIIQFYHPGHEHEYDKAFSSKGFLKKDWHKCYDENGKTINHRRKFMLNEGSYIKKDGTKDKGNLFFWGEWEPPSRVEKLTSESNNCIYGVNPKYLHIPYLPSEDHIKKYQEKLYKEKHLYQNTDPFIFGENFIYAICRQKKMSLQTLDEGSLILFGSRVNYRFVIDTVFVVKTAKKYYTLDDILNMKLDKYPEIATKFVVNKKDIIEDAKGLTLYKGATFENPVKNMYSFVPAKISDGKNMIFPRFFMPDVFYDNLKFKEYFQNSQIVDNKIYEGGWTNFKKTENLSINEINEFWNFIKMEILKKHVLGISFKMPETCMK